MKVQMMEIDKVIPYARNPRKNSRAVDKVASSIKEFGWKQPLVLDKENIIVVGHTRYEAAQKLGLKEVPIIIAEDLTPQQIKAYRIADNKTAQFSEWDDELLALELQDLERLDYDLSLTAFSEMELTSLLKDEDLLPSDLPDLGIEGEDETSDKFLVIYNDLEEKQWFIDNLGFRDKIMHTIKDFKKDED